MDNCILPAPALENRQFYLVTHQEIKQKNSYHKALQYHHIITPFNQLEKLLMRELKGFDFWTQVQKDFLVLLILSIIRSHNKIALAFASSGIAATLSEGGQIAHSALKLVLNIERNETPTCNISKNSSMAKILQKCKLIVWSEC